MCGIGGIYSFSGEPVSRERLARLSLALMHRGPDGEGEFLSSGIGLVHRRLAVIDPTERSAQPAKDMASGSALSFNGEVYNFQELRKELGREGERFDSDGDVEVLFKGLLRHGVDFIRRVDGDFAFAFWDGRSRTLFLARDRFGIKPLYYATGPGEIVFASEIKAILAAGHEARVRHSTLHEHLRFRYAQGEETLFDGIISLPPGEIAEVGAKGVSRKRYWSIDPERFQYGDYEEGLEKLDALWERSIRGRMISDVPLGTLLSGGIDSGFIAQSMEPLADGPITAMTYEVPGKLSEVRASRLLADELGYAHSVVSHRGDFFQQLPEVIRALEEPLGDSIVVPNYELFKESRKKMTVVVSGEGADEIFGGYAHHRILKSLFDLQSAGLKPALSFAAKAIPWISPRALSKLIPYPVQFDGALLDRAQ
ncbi:MAG: asparagine synthase (glutamine-hydrolyzing), partial [Bdellovibrionota bacterium]